jgi:hypothetical protein
MQLDLLCEILPLLTNLRPNLLTGPDTAGTFAAFERIIRAFSPFGRSLRRCFFACHLEPNLLPSSAKKNTGHL